MQKYFNNWQSSFLILEAYYNAGSTEMVVERFIFSKLMQGMVARQKIFIKAI